MSHYSLRKKKIEINKYKKLHNFYKYFNVSNTISYKTSKRCQSKSPNDYLDYFKKVISSILMKKMISKKVKIDCAVRYYVERKAHRFLKNTYKINRFFKSTTLLDDFKIPICFGSYQITNLRINDWRDSKKGGIIPCGIGLKFDVIKIFNFSYINNILEKIKNN
jgi:hypothetical protein